MPSNTRIKLIDLAEISPLYRAQDKSKKQNILSATIHHRNLILGQFLFKGPRKMSTSKISFILRLIGKEHFVHRSYSPFL